MNRAVARALEPILLRERESSVVAIDDAARAELKRELARVDQGLAAAEVLAGHGQMSEALAIQKRVLGEAVALATRLGEATRLGGAGAGLEWLLPGGNALSQKVRLDLEREYPGLNDLVESSHVDAFTRMAEAVLQIVSAIRARFSTVAAVRRSRVMRLGGVAVGVLFLVAFAVANRERPTATASGYFRSLHQHAPGKVLDGKPETEWLLENGQLGWLDVRFPKQDVRKVRLLNAKNVPADPRGITDFKLELMAGDQVKAQVDRSFGPHKPTPEWLEVPLEAKDVDRIRLTVKAIHNTGGGLAELAWD